MKNINIWHLDMFFEKYLIFCVFGASGYDEDDNRLNEQ